MVTPQRQQWISRTSVCFLTAVWAASLLIGCGAGPEETTGEAGDQPPVIDVTALDYAFAAPDTIPSGWVTFRMTNKGKESHHFHLFRLPDGKTFEDYRDAYITPRDSIGQLLAAGKVTPDVARKLHQRLVACWASPFNRKPGGGVGLVAPRIHSRPNLWEASNTFRPAGEPMRRWT